MNRRRFLGALGGASGTALAGCSDVELEFDQDDTPFEAPEEQIRFLQRHRAVLLYAGGVRMSAAADRAFPDLQSAVFKSPYTYAELSVYRGRVAGYYDAAAWNFARAGMVLSNLGDLDADVGVEACQSARSRAFHLGMGNIFRARATLEARFGGTEKASPISTLDDEGDRETATPTDDGGMQQARPQTETDDGGMQQARPRTETEDDWMSVVGDTAKELADAHFQEASRYDIAPVEDLRRALGLTGG